jgi:hypothetical protein
MKKNIKLLVLIIILMFLFLTACTSVGSTLPEGSTAVPLQVTSTPTQEKSAPTMEPTTAPTETVIPTSTEVPAYPNREMMPYFDILPDYDYLPASFRYNFEKFYEVARYDDHYTIRVVYQGNHPAIEQQYLFVSLTVAEEGFYNLEELSKNYSDLYEVEHPTLGEASAVLDGKRQFVWVLDGNKYIEVAYIGGGKDTFSPERAYQIAEQFYQSLPSDLTSPQSFAISFPWSNCSGGIPMYGLEFGNFSIHDDHLDRIATDLYWDTWVKYRPMYPMKEALFGLYDTEENQYTYLRYIQNIFQDNRYGYRDWMYYDNFRAAFDLMPEIGKYQFQIIMDQSCMLENYIEIYEREEE